MDGNEFFKKMPNIDFPKGIRIPNLTEVQEIMGINTMINAGSMNSIPNLKIKSDGNIEIKGIGFQIYPQRLLNHQIFNEYHFFIENEFFKYFTLRYNADKNEYTSFSSGFNIKDNDDIKIRLLKEKG